MATFLGNEIHSTEGDVTVPAAHVQILFPLKDKSFFKRVFNS